MNKKIKTLAMASILTTALTGLASADEYSAMQGYSAPAGLWNNGNNTAYNNHYNYVDPTKVNASSQNIAGIQQALANAGYNIGRFGVTGHINNSTQQAIKEFQADNHIKVDGVVGYSTAQALNSGNFVPVNNNFASNYSKNIATIQTELMELGFAVGPNGANGVYSTATAEAIRQFQAQNNLAMNGVADASTVNVMNAQVTSRRTYNASIQPFYRTNMMVSSLPESW